MRRELYAALHSCYSKVIEIKLMSYFSHASKTLLLERNKAFSAGLMLLLYEE